MKISSKIPIIIILSLSISIFLVILLYIIILKNNGFPDYQVGWLFFSQWMYNFLSPILLIFTVILTISLIVENRQTYNNDRKRDEYLRTLKSMFHDLDYELGLEYFYSVIKNNLNIFEQRVKTSLYNIFTLPALSNTNEYYKFYYHDTGNSEFDLNETMESLLLALVRYKRYAERFIIDFPEEIMLHSYLKSSYGLFVKNIILNESKIIGAYTNKYQFKEEFKWFDPNATF